MIDKHKTVLSTLFPLEEAFHWQKNRSMARDPRFHGHTRYPLLVGRTLTIMIVLIGMSAPQTNHAASPVNGGMDWLERDIPRHAASTAAKKMREGEVNGWWINTHRAQVAKARDNRAAPILFVGDSITDGFDNAGNDGGRLGLRIWQEYYEPRGAVNAGLSGDATQHVLWRLENGILDAVSPRVVVLTIGHNNREPADELAEGMLAILKRIRVEEPQAHILFIPHFPHEHRYWARSRQIRAYEQAAEVVRADPQITLLNLNEAFLNEQGVLRDKALIPDNVHPSEAGYKVWAEAMEPALSEDLPGNMAKTDS